MEEKQIKVGEITAPQGIKGEVRVYSLTDFSERFEPGTSFMVMPQNTILKIKTARQKGNLFIIKFEGIENREDAERYRGSFLQIKESELMPLPQGTYYAFQIEGLKVYEKDDRYLGVIKEIIFTGANDVYVIKRKDKPDFLIPVLQEVIQKVDLEAGIMTISIPPGLEEEV